MDNLNLKLMSTFLLLTLKLPSLDVRRKIHLLVAVKKCLDGSAPPYMQNYFKLNETRTVYKTRNIRLEQVRLEVAICRC